MLDILSIASGEIGVKESPSGSNKVKYNTWFYGKEVSGKNYPWCMTWVQWCYAQADCPLPYKTASCTGLLNWYKKNSPGRIFSKPSPGDISIMRFSPSSYHTGIVEKAINSSTIQTIEGNTSLTSNDNGGTVMRRTRKTSLVVAYIRPYDFQETEGSDCKGMNIVKGSTSNEKALIKAIQKVIGANQDGEIGTQTMSDVACLMGADCFPLTLSIYSTPVIIANDIIPFAGGGKTLGSFKNSINGSFYAGGKPCSILIQDGQVKQMFACHATYGKPESVLYRMGTGEVRIKRVISTDDLPKDIQWAVGGLGLLGNYAPTVEGFCKLTANGKTEDFSDVLRSTNHTMLGYKNEHLYLVYCANKTAAQVNSLAKKLCLESAIMLDGGHVAGINGGESFGKINTSQKQYYIIQGI